MNLAEQVARLRALPATRRMPALFIGHGSPMNAITDNPYRAAWRALGRALPRPRAIVCVSAHWQTEGTFVTTAASPETLHDFGGVPQALFDQRYAAPGAPDYAVQHTGDALSFCTDDFAFGFALDAQLRVAIAARPPRCGNSAQTSHPRRWQSL